MKIKALNSFTLGDLSLSPAKDQVLEVTTEQGNALISAGLAEEYVDPSDLADRVSDLEDAPLIIKPAPVSGE